MKLQFCFIPLLLAGCAWSQGNPFYYQPLQNVKGFLQLSDSQVQSILANNDEYNQWASQKQTRIRQVQSELAEQTAASPLDPLALGVRYAEIEAICREMTGRANEYRDKNLAGFTPDQQTKLKALEEAMKLAPVISEAQYGNLLGTFTTAPQYFASTSFLIGTGTAVTGAILGFSNGCTLPFPTAASRNGDFSSTPPSGVIPPSRWFNTSGFQRP